MNISSLSAEEAQELKKAGKIAAQALEFCKKNIKKGSNMLEAVKKTDQKILDMGGHPAFPSQISMDQIAAHFCPVKNDNPVFSGQLLKIDIGAHVNGFIGDNACTIDLSGENNDLAEASEDALKNAIKAIAPGVKICEIGRIIQETISGYGFSPIRNLGGHGLGRYSIHEKPTIPNYDNGDQREINEGDIFAVEPFATKGHGVVIETSNPTIFSFIKNKPVRDNTSRQILNEIRNYHNLPFAKWWLEEKYPSFKLNFALKQMANMGIIKEYPPLADSGSGLVSQAEHTILVEDKARILTAAED